MNAGYVATAKGSHEEWSSFHEVPGLAVGPIPDAWMEDVLALTKARMTDRSASVETMLRVQHLNRDTFWGIFERSAEGVHKLVGYQALLFLNRAGEKALIERTLDTKAPDNRFLVPFGERPAAIYNWGIVAERMPVTVDTTIVAHLPRIYYGLMHYATLATEAGYRSAVKSGFRPMTPDDNKIGGLFVYDGYIPTNPVARSAKLHVASATTSQQHGQALAIRSAVFLAEQDCPYEEEFDGNDYCATHLIGTVNGEPAATMRMRYFADMVKVERMAVLPRFRQTDIKYEIVQFAFDLARRKGYRLCYGHAQRRLLKFWQQFGFEVHTRNTSLHFSDYDYVEIVKELSPHPDPLSLHSDPMVLIRPEGQWDHPGILEHSVERSATRQAM